MAGRLGYCAADRAHQVLTGDEVRACWQAPASAEPYAGLFDGLGGPPSATTPAVAAVTAPKPRMAASEPAPRPWVRPSVTALVPSISPIEPDAGQHMGPAAARPPRSVGPGRPPTPAGPLTPAPPAPDHAGSIDDHPEPPEALPGGVSRSLLPAGLANRLRRGLGAWGARDAGASAAMPRPARPVSGRLREAPSVPPSGSLGSLADQLRRAEAIRREREGR